MATQFDTSPEVVHNPSDHLPQVYDAGNSTRSGYTYANYLGSGSDAPTPFERHSSHSQNPTPPSKETSQDPAPASGAVGEREKKSRICGLPVMVFILITALAVAVAAVIGLAVATGVAMKKSNDSKAKLNALRESYAVSSDAPATVTVTAASAAPTSTQVQADQEELTSGCSNKKDTTTGTVYTSKFMKKAKFTYYCNSNVPNGPVFSLFAINLNGCIEACNAWNSYNTTERSCQGVSFVPFWARIGNAATNNAPGDCYLKPGPQSRDGLEDAKGTHAALLNEWMRAELVN